MQDVRRRQPRRVAYRQHILAPVLLTADQRGLDATALIAAFLTVESDRARRFEPRSELTG